VTGLHVAYVDTDMTSGIDAPKADPRDVAVAALDGIEAGDHEVLADDTTRRVKSQLSADLEALYAAVREDDRTGRGTARVTRRTRHGLVAEASGLPAERMLRSPAALCPAGKLRAALEAAQRVKVAERTF
jgi:hypothetical protein